MQPAEKLTRRGFLRSAALAVAGGVLAACAPSTPASEPKPTEAQAEAPEAAEPTAASEAPGAAEEQRNITFAWWTGGEAANKVFEEAIDRFEASHPNYKVNRISVPYGDFPTKILTMYGSGNAPDCHGVPWGIVWTWAHKGILLDLTPYVERDDSQVKWKDDLWPAVTQTCYFPANGKIIALPRETFGLIIYAYNKAIFEEAGVETPDKAYEAGNWTWQDWSEKAKALTRFNGDRREIMGANCWGPEYLTLQTVMPSYGVSMFNEDLTHYNIDDPKIVGWVKLLNQMTTVDLSLGKPDEGQQFDWGASGKLGISQDATFSIPDWRQTWVDFEWDFVPPPKGDCCHTNTPANDYHVVNGADYADQEAGWELIKFLNSPEEDLWWATNMFGPPFRQSNIDAWVEHVNETLPKSGWKYIADMTEAAVPWNPVPFAQELADINNNEMMQAVLGERTVDEVIQSVATKAEELMAGYQSS